MRCNPLRFLREIKMKDQLDDEGKARFERTKPDREPILAEILQGYYPGRFRDIMPQIPLELFAVRWTTPEKRRETILETLERLERGMMAGDHYETQPNFLAEIPHAYKHPESCPPIECNMPKDVREKAWQAASNTPGHYYFHPPQRLRNADYWDVVADPEVFEKRFTCLRKFLDSFFEYLWGTF